MAGLEFGILSSHYVDDFRRKWVQHGSSETEPLLGTSDLQSLADLGNSFKTVSEIRLVPFGKDAVIRVGLFLILPLVPLTLTIVPFRQIVELLIKLAF
jgi:hypothetical protein